jgi:hypothetical protein
VECGQAQYGDFLPTTGLHGTLFYDKSNQRLDTELSGAALQRVKGCVVLALRGGVHIGEKIKRCQAAGVRALSVCTFSVLFCD